VEQVALLVHRSGQRRRPLDGSGPWRWDRTARRPRRGRRSLGGFRSRGEPTPAGSRRRPGHRRRRGPVEVTPQDLRSSSWPAVPSSSASPGDGSCQSPRADTVVRPAASWPGVRRWVVHDCRRPEGTWWLVVQHGGWLSEGFRLTAEPPETSRGVVDQRHDLRVRRATGPTDRGRQDRGHRAVGGCDQPSPHLLYGISSRVTCTPSPVVAASETDDGASPQVQDGLHRADVGELG
jgi:hypothetical protein